MKHSTPAPAASRGLHILLVEDERDVLDMLSEILAGEGHRAFAAVDGMSGLTCFQQGSYDIVFTDMNMPGISGFDLAAEIKKLNPAIPIVLLTGWDADFEPVELKARGIDALIKKPFAIMDILQAIELLCR